MRARVLALACVFTLAACGGREAPIRIEHVWSPPAPPTVQVAAVYLDVTAASDDVLLGASSPAAERVEVHESLHEDGMMRMRPLEQVALRAGETVHFAPMGKHFMVMGLRNPLPAGATLPLQLKFERAGTMSVSVPVQTDPQGR